MIAGLVLLSLLQMPSDLAGGRPVERDRWVTETQADSIGRRSLPGTALGIEAIQGLPAAAPERAAFLEGFRQAFLAKEFATEKVDRRTGAVAPAAPLRERVRLSSVDEEEGAWTAHVRLDWIAPADSAADSLARAWPGRAARVTVEVVPPDEGEPGARTPPRPAAPVTLRFPAGHPVDAPYLHNAGREVARIVIEALERARGALAEDRRLALDDARRVPPGTGP